MLFQILKKEERTKMELWATAQKEIIKNTNLNLDYGNLTFDVIQKIGNTPIIQINSKGKIIDYRNINWNKKTDKDSSYLYKKLDLFKKENKPISIEYENLITQKIYYGNSDLLKKLKYYPIALLFIIFLFAAVLYFIVQTSKISEQNKLWVGMAKETAHQIGTPLTSLMGWMTIIKDKGSNSESIIEMEKDIDRLSVITERFSKIGSFPKLNRQDINIITQKTIVYLKKRSSNYIKWNFNLSKKKINVPLNSSLFSWTLENLINNAIDSMKGKGAINITLEENKDIVKIKIQDTGKGIHSKDINQIFKPGYTSKKRGWGLGLSLSKRIIEDYHKGKIILKESKINKGSTFEIQLNKRN